MQASRCHAAIGTICKWRAGYACGHIIEHLSSDISNTGSDRQKAARYGQTTGTSSSQTRGVNEACWPATRVSLCTAAAVWKTQQNGGLRHGTVVQGVSSLPPVSRSDVQLVHKSAGQGGLDMWASVADPRHPSPRPSSGGTCIGACFMRRGEPQPACRYFRSITASSSPAEPTKSLTLGQSRVGCSDTA